MVISGLWTSMCFCYTALHAVKEGYDVYGLMDAAGDSTHDAHKYGIKRMAPGRRHSYHRGVACLGMDA
jgi:nicotinamidase-related amidase